MKLTSFLAGPAYVLLLYLLYKAGEASFTVTISLVTAYFLGIASGLFLANTMIKQSEK